MIIHIVFITYWLRVFNTVCSVARNISMKISRNIIFFLKCGNWKWKYTRKSLTQNSITWKKSGIFEKRVKNLHSLKKKTLHNSKSLSSQKPPLLELFSRNPSYLENTCNIKIETNSTMRLLVESNSVHLYEDGQNVEFAWKFRKKYRSYFATFRNEVIKAVKDACNNVKKNLTCIYFEARKGPAGLNQDVFSSLSNIENK